MACIKLHIHTYIIISFMRVDVSLYVIVNIISVKNTFTIYLYIFVFSRIYILDIQSII